MSIIGSVRTYLAAYSGLQEGAPLWVDYLGAQPGQYAIIALPGGTVLERYLNGGSLRQFAFGFQSMESSADDLERLETLGFYEALAEWMETQTESEILPALDAGKTAISIEAMGSGYLMEQGRSDTAIYQVQCKLIYEQRP